MKQLNPFNIDLLFAPDSMVRNMRPVTRTDVYDGVTNNLHDEGLFSTITFGLVGSPERDSKFSYIRLNTDVIHPAIYNVLDKLKSLYTDILLGSAYAIWDDEAKDFIPATILDGDTGYAFFISHLKELQPDKRTSKKRNLYVDIFFKYQQECLMHNCLVIPAGLRDIYQDEKGGDSQDEINDIYRKLLNAANNIGLIDVSSNDPVLNNSRRNIQLAMNELYVYIKNMLQGKRGLIQQKWGGRKIVSGTRNVISSVDTTAEELHGNRCPSVDDVQMGLLQTMLGSLPLTIHCLKTKYLDEIFYEINEPTMLLDKKTYILKPVQLDTRIWDKFGTVDGLEKMIHGFKDDRLRNKPVLLQGHYLSLTYMTDEHFCVFRDIKHFIEVKGKEALQYVHPTTYAELYYSAGYQVYYKLKTTNTRYPIAGLGSIYPASIYVKTTTKSLGLYELDKNDFKTELAFANEFPITDINAKWINTSIPSFVRLAGLGADFDGDTTTSNIMLSDKSIKEIESIMNSKSFIIGQSGGFIASSDTNIPKRVFKAFTGDPIN